MKKLILLFFLPLLSLAQLEVVTNGFSPEAPLSLSYYSELHTRDIHLIESTFFKYGMPIGSNSYNIVDFNIVYNGFHPEVDNIYGKISYTGTIVATFSFINPRSNGKYTYTKKQMINAIVTELSNTEEL